MKQRLALKHPTGWFAAGREMEQALGLLSDGAFKLYVYLCLHAQRSSGRLRFRHSELAQSLGKSPRSITSYLKELQCQGACHVEAAANQHHVGSIEIADHFWPYRKPPFETPLSDETRYIEQVRQLFLSRACVQETFSAADEKLAVELYQRHVQPQGGPPRTALAAGIGCRADWSSKLCATKSALSNPKQRRNEMMMTYFHREEMALILDRCRSLRPR